MDYHYHSRPVRSFVVFVVSIIISLLMLLVTLLKECFFMQYVFSTLYKILRNNTV